MGKVCSYLKNRTSNAFNWYTFFYKQTGCSESNIKNGLKVKKLAKQPPTLRTLMQKKFVELWINNLTFPILSSLKLKFSTTVFGTT